MEEDIQSIGKINYLLTIITGKNREVKEIRKRDPNNGSEDNYETIHGDYIITIGRKAVIITQSFGNNQVPIVVKKWRKTRNDEFDDFMKSMTSMAGSTFKAITYRDNDGYKWKYSRSGYEDEWITMHGEDGYVKYEIKIK